MHVKKRAFLNHTTAGVKRAARRNNKKKTLRSYTRKIHQSGGARTKFPELGEGRSTSIYIEPTRKDTAVLLAFYNPAGFKRILNNILYVIHILREKDIPVFIVECVFGDASPEIPKADLVVRSNSYMFYKEQLLNKLETVVPAKYTKLVMLDGDIIFDSPDWVDQISVSLDTHDIIQPYEKACWLMPGNKIIRSWKYSYGYAITNNKKIDTAKLHTYHPGFVWAFKRTIFKELGGFYPNAIVGGGDMLFTFNFFTESIPPEWLSDSIKTNIPIEAWPAYHANFKRVNPKLGIINVRALHLFHGLTLNRQYKTRYSTVAKVFDKTWDEHIIYNKDGLTEFKDPKLHRLLFSYFKSRDEDIPLKKALSITYTPKKSRKAPVLNLNTLHTQPTLNN